MVWVLRSSVAGHAEKANKKTVFSLFFEWPDVATVLSAGTFVDIVELAYFYAPVRGPQ